jgi:hypothetical protein
VAAYPSCGLPRAQIATNVFGFGLGEFIHAPNERLSVKQLEAGQKAWVEMLYELANEQSLVLGRGAGGGSRATATTAGGVKDEL